MSPSVRSNSHRVVTVTILAALLAAAALAPAQPPMDDTEHARTLTRAWVDSAADIEQARSALPAITTLDRVAVDQHVASAYLSMPAEFLANLAEHECEDIIAQHAGLLRQVEGIRGFAIYAKPLDDPTAEYRPLPSYLPPLPPAAEKPEPEQSGLRDGGLPTYNPGKPVGALSGKTVFLNPGHGWYYSDTLGRWATQRGNSYGIIEDHSNGEAVLQHLTRYFHNAGADVWPCRERDFNTNMVIVDNANGAPAYTTTGTWTSSSGGGVPYGSDYQVKQISPTETGVATYAPDIPEAGHYAVYVWTPSASNRATDATVRVNHTGGTTTHIINMQRDGNTWRFLGMYYFAEGRNPADGSVEISNQGSDTSKYAVADAVRFGGGMGDYSDGGSVSGKARWEESGAYYPVLMGQRSTAGGTVSAMPQYADWQSQSWNDSIYIAWHTNASSGSGHGSSVWAYGPGSPPSPFGEFSGIVGSDSLAIRVRDELRDDLRIAWNDPSWPANLYTAWFGELNPNYNDEMPSILLEVAYHDSATDADSILDPRFRDMVARAIYQGTVKWWRYDADGPNTTPLADATLLPEPPTHLAVRNLANGDVRVSWHAPPYNTGDDLLGHPATDYLVQISEDGYGFDDGTETSATELDFSGLTAGKNYFFRVIAANAGGQSFPSEIGGVLATAGELSPVLVVNGFDRMDRQAMLSEDDPYDADPMIRERPERMNSYGYIRTFGAALHQAGVDFDSCSNEAVRDGDVSLGAYTAAIWASGEESSANDTFDATEQSIVSAYLGAGGQLFASGSEIGWDLDALGNGASFYHNYLKAAYAADDADTYGVTPAAGSIFDGIPSFDFDDGTTIYNVDYPDTLTPYGGATGAMSYLGGVSGTAAVVYDGAFRVVTFGFPFEAITESARRIEILTAILGFFGLDTNDPPPPPPNDVIVESRDAAGTLTPPPAYVEHGAWANSSIKSNVSGLTGTGSRFITYTIPNTGTDNTDFVPNIVTPAKYEVFVTWANGANCYDSLHTVRHHLGETELLVDQIAAGAPEPSNYNTWVSLGEYWFDAGQSLSGASVNVSEETVSGQPSAGWNPRVYADAVKWEFVEWWPHGDYNDDNLVDLADYAALPDCLTGPGGGYAQPECLAFDFDLDEDVDLEDFAAFQVALTE